MDNNVFASCEATSDSDGPYDLQEPTIHAFLGPQGLVYIYATKTPILDPCWDAWSQQG